MTYEELLVAQETLEAEAIGDAQAKAFAALQAAIAAGEVSNTRGGSNLLQGALPLISLGIARYLETQEGPGRKPKAVDVLKALDQNKVAYISLFTLLNRVTSPVKSDVRSCGNAIGKALEMEVWFKDLPVEVANAIYEKVVSDHSDLKVREKSARVIAKRKGHDYTPWEPEDRIHVGRELLNIIISATGLVETTQDNSVILSEECNAYLTTTNDKAASLAHQFIPMVVKPRRWKTTWTGAYRTAKLRAACRLVRTHDKAHIALVEQHIESGAAKAWLHSINKVQETPFKINVAVLEVMEKVWQAGGGIGKLTQKAHVEKAKFPDNYEELKPEEQKGWRIIGREIAMTNRGIDSDIIIAKRDLEIARKLAEFDEFYVPVSCDFRGRVYPVPAFNYQRADHVKSLFLFAKGMPLGDHGLMWLMIHCANVGDFDKVSKLSFEDRLRWCHKHRTHILAVADNPMFAINWWGKADKPWQFLAACIELAKAWLHYDHRYYVSYLAIPLDGSNSGLQHYSASMRAEAEAALVNLVPSEQPADIYATVASKVLPLIEAELNNHEPINDKSPTTNANLAELWLGYGVDRKIVKRAVMTYPYSSGQFGFREQFEEDLMKPLSTKVLKRELENHPFADKDTQWKACGLMAKATYTAILDTVSRASVGMKFYQDIAGVLAHEKKPVAWTTPLGYPVVHSYTEWDVKVLDWWLTDLKLPLTPESTLDHGGNPMRRICANIRVKPTEVIKKTKQRSAISPNVIHSADATHLLLSVIRGEDAGIHDYQLIHDSFATHAGNTQRYFSVIREAFVELYEAWDPFQAIYDSAWLQLSETGRAKLPTVPTKGNLDLRSVLQSPYAFA